MNARLPALLLLLLPLRASAQIPPAPTLQMDGSERQFFQFGITLSRAAFAYADLARQVKAAQKTRSKSAQVAQLGKLEPVAHRDRLAARDGLTLSVGLMRALGAPAAALAPFVRASDALAGPLPITEDAKPVAFFNEDAARTLSALNEFETLSSLPEDPALRRWLTSPPVSDSAPVWYGEGEVLGLAQVAAADQMPDLLPPAEQIATDLRGLRDWLAGRLPDTPSPEQAALKNALEAFLQQVAQAGRPGVKSNKPLTPAQLQALGDLSRHLQAQILGPSPLPAAPPQTSSSHLRSPD